MNHRTTPVAHGVFGWHPTERRSDRYGSFHLSDSGLNGRSVAAMRVDLPSVRALAGQRVWITCAVVATRDSSHVGDLTYGIKPSRPNVGEEVDLGVGTLLLYPAADATVSIQFGLQPDDERERFWFNPEKLYRLHEQTVDVFIWPTTAACTPAWAPPVRTTGAPSVTDAGDGNFQAKHATDTEAVRAVRNASVQRIGDGLFKVGYDPKPGRKLPM